MERFCRDEQKAASTGRLEELVLFVFLLSLVSCFSLTGNLGFALSLQSPGASQIFQTANDKKAKLSGNVCKEMALKLKAESKATVENSERDGNTRPPDLPLEKSVCRSGSNS